jgi:hypothetical protein
MKSYGPAHRPFVALPLDAYLDLAGKAEADGSYGRLLEHPGKVTNEPDWDEGIACSSSASRGSGRIGAGQAGIHRPNARPVAGRDTPRRIGRVGTSLEAGSRKERRLKWDGKP